MTMTRRVFAPLECKRCRHESSLPVSFCAGTAGEDTYRMGQVVPPEDRLQAGETFRGSSPRYCPACLKEWQKAETSARYKYMADVARDGRMALSPYGGSSVLTPEQILDLGAAAIDDVIAGHGAPPPPTQNWLEFSYTWGDVEAVPADEAYRDANQTLDAMIERELVRTGWRWGRNTERHNLRVLIDADGRIRVDVMRSAAACPVCTLEPAFEEPFDPCPRCGWFNDPLQHSNPEAFGSNLMTLAQAVNAWREGRPVR